MRAIIFWGIITSLAVLNTWNIGYWVFKLWLKDQVVAGLVWFNIALDPVIIIGLRT